MKNEKNNNLGNSLISFTSTFFVVIFSTTFLSLLSLPPSTKVKLKNPCIAAAASEAIIIKQETMLQCSSCKSFKVLKLSQIRFLFWDFKINDLLCCKCVKPSGAFQSSYPLLMAMFGDTVLYLGMMMRALNFVPLSKKNHPSRPRRSFVSRNPRTQLLTEIDCKMENAQLQHSFLNKVLSSRGYLRKCFKSLGIEGYNFGVGDVAFMNAVTFCGCEIESLKRACRSITIEILSSGERTRRRNCSLSFEDDSDLGIDPFCLV